MEKDKIKWCVKTRNGIELVEPNDNLAQAYLKKASDSLESMRAVRSRDWKISTAYYTMYFSLYSVMMKAGIKCEIHSCTIEVMKTLFSDYFNDVDCRLLEDSYKARVEAQYYVDEGVTDRTYERMVEGAPVFLVKCRNVISAIDAQKTEEIRSNLRKVGGLAY